MSLEWLNSTCLLLLISLVTSHAQHYAATAPGITPSPCQELTTACSSQQHEPCPPCPDPAPPTVCPGCSESDNTLVSNEKLEESEKNLRKLFSLKHRRRTRATSMVHLQNKCNNDFLRVIMLQSITPNIVITKVTIAERASREIGGIFNVVCSSGVFTYYAAAKLFCEVTLKGVSCFAFRHDNIVVPSTSEAKGDVERAQDFAELPEFKFGVDDLKSLKKKESDGGDISIDTVIVSNHGKDEEAVESSLELPEVPEEDFNTQRLRAETLKELSKNS